MVIKDVYITNQHINEKKKALQDHDEAAARRVQLEQAILRVCSELHELQIQSQATSEDKVQQLAYVFKELKARVDKVHFDLQLQIIELQLKLQPTTLLEI